MYQRFENLEAWKQAREFRISIYKIVRQFPQREAYALGSQLWRAAVSVTANIAEGYGRYHWQENVQSCRIARGSLNEVLDHLYTALDCEYITQEQFTKLYEQGRYIERLLNGYIKFLSEKKMMS